MAKSGNWLTPKLSAASGMGRKAAASKMMGTRRKIMRESSTPQFRSDWKNKMASGGARNLAGMTKKKSAGK
jgi:hypothetical protein